MTRCCPYIAVINVGSDYWAGYVDTGAQGIEVSNQSDFVFQVQGDGDVFVGLMTNRLNTSQMYEIVIGGWSNTQSVIRNVSQSPTLLDVHMENSMFNSSSFLPFWVSWADGIIKAGKGYIPGIQTFLQWTDSSPYPINYLAFNNWDPSNTLTFNINIGKKMYHFK